MAKVVCEDCGDIIAEDVDPDTAKQAAQSHAHGDAPHVQDKREDAGEDPDETGGGSGSGGIGADQDHDDDEVGSAGREAAPDEASGGVDGDPEMDASDALARMDDQDNNRQSADWYNVDDSTDYREVDEDFVRRFEKVRKQVEKERSSLGRRLSARDDIGLDGLAYDYGEDRQSDFIRKQDEWQHLRDDIVDAFREFKSRNAPVPSRSGNALNMDAITQRAAGDKSRTRLFTRKEQVAKGDRAVGVACDFSGSMNELEVKMAVAAVAKATEIIGDDFVATAWGKKGRNVAGETRGGAKLGMITGPDESFEWEQLDAHETGGGTPTCYGVEDIADVLQDVTAREKVAIIVTDGKPNINFEGEHRWITGDAVDDTAHVVREARDNGINVIGLGVGYVDDKTMARIFGPNGFVSAEMDDLASKLVEVYRDQLRV